ncbi:hypothetical protein D3C81_1408980 [compost metagenome]
MQIVLNKVSEPNTRLLSYWIVLKMKWKPEALQELGFQLCGMQVRHRDRSGRPKEQFHIFLPFAVEGREYLIRFLAAGKSMEILQIDQSLILK